MTSKDLISRQAAIDAINQICPIDTEYDCTLLDRVDVRCVLTDLPSAQPEIDEWCTDCKEYDSEKHCCPRFNKVIRQAMKDAQPERKKGKWIRHDEVKNVYGGICIECPECGEKYVVQYIEDEKYCRNCGADMRQKEGSDGNRFNNP